MKHDCERPPYFVTLGMFIIDEFSFLDEAGHPTGKSMPPQIGGGGTYANIGARIWLPAAKVAMIVDRGHDFPPEIQSQLEHYGKEMWLFRDDKTRPTTRALNLYHGERRGFQYMTPRVRISPRDLANTRLERPATLHFICSPSRAAEIVSEIRETPGWSPTTIYEPIPDRCVPEELPALIQIVPSISILSPNAEEALSLLSMPSAVTKPLVEEACQKFLNFGIGADGTGYVVIRSGGMGAYVASRREGGQWIDAFWDEHNTSKVIDVTGAGNAFLGGLAAGLLLTGGDVFGAGLHATVSASYVIEQEGLPRLEYRRAHNDQASLELWNEDLPESRLENLRKRLSNKS